MQHRYRDKKIEQVSNIDDMTQENMNLSGGHVALSVGVDMVVRNSMKLALADDAIETSTDLESEDAISKEFENAELLPQVYLEGVDCAHKHHHKQNKNTKVCSNVQEGKVNGTIALFLKTTKRSSSSSNDLLYERDRFRARLQALNKPEKDYDEAECDVCDGIGSKTTKLNLVTEGEKNSLVYGEFSISPDFHPDMKIRQVNVEELRHIFNIYFNTPLPATRDVFPWLHGLNKDNYAQKQYFLYQEQKTSMKYSINKPKNIRFTMCIGSTDNELALKNTVQLHEILQPIDTSKVEVRLRVHEIINKVYPSATEELKNQIVEDCIALNHLPIFLNIDPDRGVSLRNFQIQVAKLATCSDFIIYGSNYRRITRVLWLAQRLEAHQEDSDQVYDVYVLPDVSYYDESLYTVKPSNSLLEFKKTQLPLKYFRSDTLSIWDTDYPIKEKIETTKMSSASKLNKNVWVGNIWDHQIMLGYFDDPNIHIVKSNKINLFCDPNNSITTQDNKSDNIFDYLSYPRANWRIYIYCHDDAEFPSLSVLGSLLFKFTISSHRAIGKEHHHLEFPPSGSIGIGNCKQENLMSIVNTCKLLYLCSSSTSNADDVLSSLIYCSDGYTELSLLVLCYLMYSKNIPLDEAMLELHITYGRPFYIFGSDVTILKKLEILLRKYSPSVLGKNIVWSDLETISSDELNEVLLSSENSIKLKPSIKKFKLGFINSESDEESSSSDDEDYLNNKIDWVKEVEGSMPSKILPYLYLGSLKHANNLTLMSKLDIKYVISVGEPLDWLLGYRFKRNHQISNEVIENRKFEIFKITPNKSSTNSCTVKSVLKVNNLQDDGIDELSNSLPFILDFIDQIFKESKGESKILVHCRVGVSRSATVVIAEVMKRLHISLAKAYLYVRVRRLNIIIQPNLRFMYELFKWEEQKRLETIRPDTVLREIDWFVMAREIMKLNVPYLTN